MTYEATHPALSGWHYDPADFVDDIECPDCGTELTTDGECDQCADEPDLDDIPDDELEWDARILIGGEWTVLWRGCFPGAKARAEGHAADARAGTQYPATVVVSCRRPQ